MLRQRIVWDYSHAAMSENYDESAARGTANPPPANAAVANSAVIYDGTIAGKRVQLFGAKGSPMLTDAQALERLKTSNAQSDTSGATDPAMWAATHPGASPAELAAYNKSNAQYRTSTSMTSMGTKLKNAAKFEVSRATNLVKNVAHDPSRLLTGVDPLSTKATNAVLGTNKAPLVDQLGGATPQDFSSYEAKHGQGSLGAARALSTSADAIAGMAGAAGAAHGLGQALNSLKPLVGQGGPTGNDLGVFSQGGQGGMSQVGLDNAGRLAAEGGITGGAGAVGIPAAGAIVKGVKLASTLRDIINAANPGSPKPNPTVGDASTVDSSVNPMLWGSSGKPLRRFQRTPETIFQDFRGTGANPMSKINIPGQKPNLSPQTPQGGYAAVPPKNAPRAAPVAPPTRVPAPAARPVAAVARPNPTIGDYRIGRAVSR